ncbi:MAG: FkbM family methyltransferase [Promethearchaeota archaeon]
MKSKRIQNLIMKIQALFFNDSTSIFYFINDFVSYKRDKLMYNYAKDIYEYSLINHIDLDSYFAKFDSESKKILEEFFNKIYYIYTHNLLERKKLLSSNDLKHKTTIINSIKHYKDKFFLPIDKYDNSIFYYNTGLKLLPKKVIQKLEGTDFIDGGAFIGDSALIYEKLYTPRTIIAFEPEQNNYKLLLETIKKNNLKKVIPQNLGLGEKKEILKISSESSSSSISHKGDQEIQVISIDNYALEHNLVLGLIKLDVEGLELEVLKGAKKTIEKDKPLLIISIYHNGKEFFETFDYIKKLNPNYKCIVRRLNHLTPIYELVLICWYEDE